MLSTTVKQIGEQTNKLGNSTVADIKYIGYEVRSL